MADEIDTQDDDVLELTDELEPEGEAHEPAEEDGEDDDADEGEFAIEIDGEEAQPEETPLVRQLRQAVRDKDRELSGYRKVTPAKIEVGPEPTLEGADFDEDKFKTEWRKWNERSQQAANAEREAEQAETVKNQEAARLFTNYRTRALSLPVKDFDDAEKTVTAAIPELLQSAILRYAKQPEKVVYALAKHPAKLAALAAEPDIVKSILDIAELERNLKVVNRKAPPAPEAASIQRGSAPLTASSDKRLERLEKEAERTGDRKHVVAYKAKLRQAA